MARRQDRVLTDGARQLRAYVDKNYPRGGVPRFCEENSLDRISVQRALNGETKRISVDLAVAIEDATSGRVKIRSWRGSTASEQRAA